MRLGLGISMFTQSSPPPSEGGGGAPEWLPDWVTDYADFKNGHYYGAGVEKALADIVTETSARVDGVGLVCDVAGGVSVIGSMLTALLTMNLTLAIKFSREDQSENSLLFVSDGPENMGYTISVAECYDYGDEFRFMPDTDPPHSDPNWVGTPGGIIAFTRTDPKIAGALDGANLIVRQEDEFSIIGADRARLGPVGMGIVIEWIGVSTTPLADAQLLVISAS